MDNENLEKHLQYIVPQIRLALIKEAGIQPRQIYRPDDIERFIEPLKHYDSEYFVALHLNVKNEVVGYQIVSQGTVSESIVHPREVYKAAILSNASGIIVAHNHPAGSLTPSKEDIETTEKLMQAGELLGIKLIDHIIVSSNGLRSLREMGDCRWQ